MSEQKKQVFFLGAGFSKALDKSYPLMNDLSDYIRNELNQGTDTTSKHYQNEVPNSLKNNVEHLLTYLSTELPWKGEGYLNDQALYEKITGIINDRFLNLVSSFKENKETKFLGKYFFNNYNCCNIITLNYDLMIESCISSFFHRFCSTSNSSLDISYFYKYPMPYILNRMPSNSFGYASPPKEKRFPSIIKLHGSVNWYRTGLMSSDIIYYSNNRVDDIYYTGLKPFIIPPVMDKNSFYNHIAIHHLWKISYEFISNADEIYIIGFSFPQTDASVRFLFQSALKDNTAVYIVNRDINDVMKEHLRNVFGKDYNGKSRTDLFNYDFCGQEKYDNHAVQRFFENKLNK